MIFESFSSRTRYNEEQCAQCALSVIIIRMNRIVPLDSQANYGGETFLLSWSKNLGNECWVLQIGCLQYFAIAYFVDFLKKHNHNRVIWKHLCKFYSSLYSKSCFWATPVFSWLEHYMSSCQISKSIFSLWL